MKNKLYILFYIFFTICISAESIAVTTKVKGDVKYKKKSQKELKNPLKVGYDLYNNDYVRTGNDGFAKYVYLDDGTQIKVHNNTEVFIHGELSRRSILKQLKVKDGTVKLDVKKQTVDEFTVITPTSVASVKGTSFWLDCSGRGGDRFYGESGLVSITNKASGARRQLSKNTVASSMPDGSIELRKITPEELKMLENIEEDAGESDNSSDEDGNSSSNNNGESEIKIELEDESGNQKTIVIIVK